MLACMHACMQLDLKQGFYKGIQLAGSSASTFTCDAHVGNVTSSVTGMKQPATR